MATVRAALALFDKLETGGQWLLENLRFADARRNAERQLQVTLPEMGVLEMNAAGMNALGMEIPLSWDWGAANEQAQEKAAASDYAAWFSQSVGFGEALSDTPAGKIVQLQEAFADLRADLGDQLYPAVLQFADAFKERLPQVANILSGLVNAFALLLTV